MKLVKHKLFANLCEAYLPEASTTMNLAKKNPGAEEVIQSLHQAQGLAHNQEYSPIPKISWNDVKDRYQGAWVLIVGPNGTGAIKAKNKSYFAVASNGAGVQSLQNDRGGNILDFLQGIIGGKWQNYSYYIGTDNRYASDTKRKRQQGAPAPTVLNQDALVVKFRPLWTKSMEAAVADIKGMITTMIKNNAFDKAENKLRQLKTLQSATENMEAGEKEVPSFIKSAVNVAILMAASHHYPDTTGEITKQRYGSSGYETQHSEGPKQLLADISAGDTAKLGTILAFFKRSLISG